MRIPRTPLKLSLEFEVKTDRNVLSDIVSVWDSKEVGLIQRRCEVRNSFDAVYKVPGGQHSI